MPKRKHTAEGIINKLREAEVIIAAGSTVVEAASCIGISEQTFCRWQAEYGGLRVDQARRLGLGELVDSHVDVRDAPGRANAGDKMLTLAASALAGGDCIDDADVLCAGGTAGAIGCAAKAPSTLRTFPRSFRWGHVRQLGRVSRELLMRARAAGAGPGCGSLTIDIDSTVCETYGLAKKGAPAQLRWPAGLSPTAGHCRRHWRCADGSAAPGSGQHGAGRPTSWVKPWDGRATPGPRVNSPCRPTAVATRTTSSPSGAKCLSTSPSPFASTPDCAKHHQGPAWTSHPGKPTMPSSATKVEATRRPSRHSAVPALDDTLETLPKSFRTPGLPSPKGPKSLPSPGNTRITPPDHAQKSPSGGLTG